MSGQTIPCLVRHLTLLGLAVLACTRGNGENLDSGDGEHAAVLTWRNGDQISGKLQESGEGMLHFEATPFAEPLQLGLDQLSGIRFSQNSGSTEPKDTSYPVFEISLKNGDRLEGKLLEMTREKILVECAPLEGEVSINRSEIVRMTQLRRDQVRLFGLGELGRWSSTGRDRKPTDWYTDLRGEFATHQWSGNLFKEINLPNSVEIHFHAEFPLGNPSLEVGLLRTPQEGPMLETWDKHLVLTYKTRFIPVMEMTEATKELDLRLFWNQATGDVILCSASGKKLASLRGEPLPQSASTGQKSAAIPRGFYILNRTPEIRFTSLNIREWDGTPVPVIDLTQPRLHLQDEPVRFRVSDVTLERGTEQLTLGGRSFPLADLSDMVLSTAPIEIAQNTSDGSTRVAWHSGITLSGRFLRLGPGDLTFQPPLSDAAVTGSFEHAREVRFPESATPIEQPTDTLSGNGFSVR